mgnify:CR=1 FL=1
MTKELLEQYQSLCKEIKELKQEIDNMRRDTTTKDSVAGSSPHYPHTIHQIVIEGVDYEHRPIVEAMQRQLQRAINQRTEIEEYIASIDDSEIRLIARLKYLRGMSWQQIAFQIGRYDEQRPRKKMYDFLRKDEKDESRNVK